MTMPVPRAASNVKPRNVVCDVSFIVTSEGNVETTAVPLAIGEGGQK